MTEDREKDQSERDQHAPEDAPKDNVDAQRGQADQPPVSETAPVPAQGTPVAAQAQAGSDEEGVPQDAPEGYEPQVELQPGQTGGMVERPGEQVSDVEAAVDDQIESSADQNDDEAVEEPDPGFPE